MNSFKNRKEIRVAVVGYGGAFNMGRKHLEGCGDAGMVPTAIVDIDKKRLAAAESDFPGIETYTSVNELLKRSSANLIVIITPHNTHAKLAIQCARAGRHVVVEKPFAITTHECDSMIAAARKSGVMLSTYHNRHWDGCILGATKTIRSGAIGEIVRVDAHMGGWAKPRDWWRSSRSVSGGILYDWGVHLLEYSLQLIDSEITEVSGFSTTGVWDRSVRFKDDTIESESTAIVRFKSGVLLSLRISTIETNPKPGWLEITGTKRSYIFDNVGWEKNRSKSASHLREQGKNPESEHWRFYDNVAGYLVGKVDLVITPEWARRPVHIIDLAVRSARLGKSLQAKYE